MSYKSTARFRVLLAFAFWVVAVCTCRSQISNSLVSNTWQVSVTRISSSVKETGSAFINFNSDGTYSGQGITTLSGGMFTIFGFWSVTAKGQIIADYGRNSGSLSGTATGKASTKLLTLTVSDSAGTYRLTGKPMVGNVPDLSGLWNLSFTVLHSTAIKTITITPMDGYPGIFQYSGTSPDDVSGEVIVTSAGKLAFYLDEATSGNAVGMTGTFNARSQTARASGKESNGYLAKATLTRL